MQKFNLRKSEYISGKEMLRVSDVSNRDDFTFSHFLYKVKIIQLMRINLTNSAQGEIKSCHVLFQYLRKIQSTD